MRISRQIVVMLKMVYFPIFLSFQLRSSLRSCLLDCMLHNTPNIIIVCQVVLPLGQFSTHALQSKDAIGEVCGLTLSSWNKQGWKRLADICSKPCRYNSVSIVPSQMCGLHTNTAHSITILTLTRILTWLPTEMHADNKPSGAFPLQPGGFRIQDFHRDCKMLTCQTTAKVEVFLDLVYTWLTTVILA